MSSRRELIRQYWLNLSQMNAHDLYEDWMDEIVSLPLVSNSILTEEVTNALQINQQLINNLHSLRRHLELDTMDTMDTMETIDTMDAIGTMGTVVSGVRRHRRREPNVNRLSSNNNFVINSIGNSEGVFDFFRNLLEVMIEPSVNTEMEDIKVTLTEADFNNLPHQIITEHVIKGFDHKECNVCIESYKVGDSVVTLPCEHYFHEKCIRGWLCNEKVTCPVCRHDTRELYNNKKILDNAEDSTT